MKKAFITLFLIIVGLQIIGFTTCNGYKEYSFSERLKDLVNTSSLKRHEDKTYGFIAKYPSFFKCDSITNGYACFGFHIETNILMEYFVIPNEGRKTMTKAMKQILAESHATESKINENGFTISGVIFDGKATDDEYRFYTKYIYGRSQWYVCRLTYESKYEAEINRLKQIVDDWMTIKRR